MAKVGFIGLGVMGYPMAGHLQKAGHEVTVYNRTTPKAHSWRETYEGSVATIPREAAMGKDFVFACVGGDDDLRSVVLGDDGAFSGMDEGCIFIDNTTASASVARELSATGQSRGIGFIDAPVSGGQAGAEGGILTVMCGGNESDFKRAEPIMRAYGKKVEHIGEVGSGQQAKMVNQICIAGVLQGLSEGIAFGERAGLDMEKVLETISGGAAQSWQMVNRGKTMTAREFNFGFALDWMIKDLGICIDEAATNGADLTITREVLSYYKALSEEGHGREDTSALIRRLS